jgi:hypothetical protein
LVRLHREFLHCGRRTVPVRVQHYFELSVIEYTRDNGNGVRTSGSPPWRSTVKVGLLNDADRQLVLDPYARVETETDAREETMEVSGGAQLRLKINLWRNDGLAPPISGVWRLRSCRSLGFRQAHTS